MKNIGKNRRFFFQKKPKKKKEGNLLKFHRINVVVFDNSYLETDPKKKIALPSSI